MPVLRRLGSPREVRRVGARHAYCHRMTGDTDRPRDDARGNPGRGEYAVSGWVLRLPAYATAPRGRSRSPSTGPDPRLLAGVGGAGYGEGCEGHRADRGASRPPSPTTTGGRRETSQRRWERGITGARRIGEWPRERRQERPRAVRRRPWSVVWRRRPLRGYYRPRLLPVAPLRSLNANFTDALRRGPTMEVSYASGGLPLPYHHPLPRGRPATPTSTGGVPRIPGATAFLSCPR